jgi:hypothetical protein
MSMQTFLKEKVAPFRSLSNERLQRLVDGSCVGLSEANEVIRQRCHVKSGAQGFIRAIQGEA